MSGLEKLFWPRSLQGNQRGKGWKLARAGGRNDGGSGLGFLGVKEDHKGVGYIWKEELIIPGHSHCCYAIIMCCSEDARLDGSWRGTTLSPYLGPSLQWRSTNIKVGILDTSHEIIVQLINKMWQCLLDLNVDVL